MTRLATWLRTPQGRKVADITERAFWTGVQYGLGYITAEAINVPAGYGGLVAVALSSFKSYVATKTGRKDSASSLPASIDSKS